VNLAIGDEKLGSGWSFSRCYKCGGFALIRKAEVNLIKVDRAPAGENVLLPEGSEQPLAMLSEGAMQNLSRIRKNSAEKTRMAENAIAPPPLPQSLPELREDTHTSQRKILGAAISLAAVATVGSGIYLYIQGQTLWEKARTNRTLGIEQTAYKASEVIPAPPLNSRPTRNLRLERNELSDQVHDRAMAPVRNGAAEPANPMPQASPGAMLNPNSINSDSRSVLSKETR
jgi:hypothetical protein